MKLATPHNQFGIWTQLLTNFCVLEKPLETLRIRNFLCECELRRHEATKKL